ncbi:hypothetical protein FQN57_006336 [Myotisia sp. PD_48]|nr:hypothetical protein FQN57_006336 [Myotisia sp. PD_48]
MATTTFQTQKSVGSTEWVVAEQENVVQLVQQEMEEVEFPVRHEMEWLNEHMAEIFSSDKFNVTELFKTPGKLRGKTPRTTRKFNTPREARVPLSDVFSSGHNAKWSPTPVNRFNQDIAKLASKHDSQQSPPSNTQNSNPNYNTDSGYHGMPEAYEMGPKQNEEEEEAELEAATQLIDESTILPIAQVERSLSPARRMTEDSFHSAREVAPSKENTVEPMDFEYSFPGKVATIFSNPNPLPKPATMIESTPTSGERIPVTQSSQEDLDEPSSDDIGSPSEGPTPARPPIRKSSLSFASLPAREPLTTQRSMGGSRMSKISHIDSTKSNVASGPQFGYSARLTQMRLDELQKTQIGQNEQGVDVDYPSIKHENQLEGEGRKLHNKSSTQLLNEKITMLGKSQSSRPVKSAAFGAAQISQQLGYPELPTSALSKNNSKSPVDERAFTLNAQSALPNSPLSKGPLSTRDIHVTGDDKPVVQGSMHSPNQSRVDMTKTAPPFSDRQLRSPNRFDSAAYHSKSASVPALPTSPYHTGPRSPEKTTSTERPLLGSTTPTTSPRRYDGPLSASKSRLQSIMKTAKGLFTSSAGVSAAAKMETLSPTAQRPQSGLYSTMSGVLGQTQTETSMPDSPSTRPAPPRTRGSLEREQRYKNREQKDRQRMEEQLEKAREEERQRIARSKALFNPAVEQKLEKIVPPEYTGPKSPRKPSPVPKQLRNRGEEPSAVPEPKFAVPDLPQGQTKQPDSRVRPVKLARDGRKPKPQPVNIKVGTLSSQRIRAESVMPMPPPVSNVAQQQQSAPKPPIMSKKGSNSSLQRATSTNNFKSSISKSKAALAAERRKEQEHREAQKKMEQRREAERKKAVQSEEARRLELSNMERHEREQSVLADPKKFANKQAIEKRRLENAKRLEQQHSRQPTPSVDTSSIMQEKSILTEPQDKDKGPIRPPSRLNSTQPPNRLYNYPPPNTAKPPKRVHEDQGSVHISNSKAGVLQLSDGKRRKTEEEISVEQPIRQAMAPPIRQSNVRKDGAKPPSFAGPAKYSKALPQKPQMQGFPPMIQASASGQANSQTSQPQRNVHPLEMAKYTSGKIPFAENPGNFKTPGPSQQRSNAPKTPLPQSSPAYPNGENIKLPDIPTDSEDEDSDAEPYDVPEWAKAENLHNILLEQEGKDGEMVFGPTAPLRMEEIFKGSKERIHKFRDRTSSANWNGPDGLTQAEIRWDLAEREKLKNNGGWIFSPH